MELCEKEREIRVAKLERRVVMIKSPENRTQEQFWKIRSKRYNNLKWVNDSSYIKAFISSTDFNKNDLVLDVGTGTGVIAHALAPFVKEVIGLDISQDMLKHSNWNGNKYFIKRDIRDPIFYDNVFDKVTARLVFHHIVRDTQKAMNVIGFSKMLEKWFCQREYLQLLKLRESIWIYLS